MSSAKENLRLFKIYYSSQFIQIIPMLEHFRTQILINKRTNAVQFEGNSHCIQTFQNSFSFQAIIRWNLPHWFLESSKLKEIISFFSQNMSMYSLFCLLIMLQYTKSHQLAILSITSMSAIGKEMSLMCFRGYFIKYVGNLQFWFLLFFQ